MAANASPCLKELPDCWGDEKKMNSLFSPFRAKDINPVDYEFKMNFWVALLDSWCLECGRACFTLKYLQTALRRNNSFPSCLQTVVDELLKSGDLMTKEKFQSLNSTDSWAMWAMKSIFKVPAVLSFNKYIKASTEIDPSEVEYISIKYLKAVASDVITRCQKEDTKMMPFEDFVTITKASTQEQASHVLKWLINSGDASTIVRSGRLVVKVGKGSISEAEVAVMELNKTINRLTASIKVLELEKIQALNDARSYITKNLKQMAKSCLRRKKYLDEHLNKKVNIIDNLNGLLCRLQESEVNAEVMESYKLGITALKSSLSSSGLDPDSVAETMTELEEIKEIHDEIEGALARNLDLDEESELEEEWKAILNADAREPDTSLMANLPAVPTSDPGSTTIASKATDASSLLDQFSHISL